MPEDGLTGLLGLMDHWAGREVACSCRDGVHRVPTQRVVFGEDALGRLPTVADEFELPRQWLVVGDPNTFAAAGDRVVDAGRSAGVPVETLDLGADVDVADPFVVRVRQTIDDAATAGRPVLLVAVGSGAINDVVKMAAEEAGLAYVCCATAPSMNGYPSSISAIFRGGVKRTLPARPPMAIFADTAVLRAAPPKLVASGFADLLSKPLCNGDWWLAHRMLGEPYCTVPVSIMADAVERLADGGKAVRRGNAEAIDLLSAGLILSGFAMAAAGHSRPASGAEHLVSHYWDMIGHRDGTPLDLHGRQVGVGCLLALEVWHRVLAVSADEVLRAAEQPPRPLDEHIGTIRSIYGSLSPGVEAEYAKKHVEGPVRADRLRGLARIWDEVRTRLLADLPTVDQHRQRLEAAGAPTSPEEVGQSTESARAAVRYGRYLRARYTVLDLAADLAVLEN